MGLQEPQFEFSGPHKIETPFYWALGTDLCVPGSIELELYFIGL